MPNRHALPLVALILSVGPFVATGCALKVGAQQMDSPRGDGESRTRVRYEAELISPRIMDNHVEVTAAVGFVPISRSDEEIRVREFNGSVTRFPVERQDLTDLRAGLRIFPFASVLRPGPGVIEPYIVGGGGFFFNTVTQRDVESNFRGDRFFIDEDQDTISDGFFPYVGGGLHLNIGYEAAILLEARQDFSREDNGFDTSGTSILLGIRWTY